MKIAGIRSSSTQEALIDVGRNFVDHLLNSNQYDKTIIKKRKRKSCGSD